MQCHIKCLKIWLLTKDIAVRGLWGWKVTSELLDQTTPMPIGFIGSGGSSYTTNPCQQPTSPPFMIMTHHTTIIPPMIHAPPSFPMHLFFHISHLYVFLLLFSLHGLLIQPSWLQSILIGCSTHLTFSRKCPYWMVLMPVYMEMAEGLVKPLVILPATVMPFPSFIFIFSQCHHPFVLTDSFSPTTHFASILSYESFLCPLSPLSLIAFPLSYPIREQFLFMAEQCSKGFIMATLLCSI